MLMFKTCDFQLLLNSLEKKVVLIMGKFVFFFKKVQNYRKKEVVVLKPEKKGN